MKSFSDILDKARQGAKLRIAIASADDPEILLAAKDAGDFGIADPVLIGDAQKIESLSRAAGFSLKDIEVINEPDPVKAPNLAVSMVKTGHAHILMKGRTSTANVLRAVLDKENGLRTGRLLSHITILEVPAYHKLLFLSDGAQNIAPDLAQKIQITGNAIEYARSLGIETPKTAILTALEHVNPKMPATVDAQKIQEASERGEFNDCVVHGPLAFDCAISEKAAAIKGIDSKVAGDVDVLIVPSIECGNVLYKALVYLANAKVAGIITGAGVPVVLTSRSDTHEAKFYSIACAVIGAKNRA